MSALEKAINDYIVVCNGQPGRIVWKADGEEILRKINEARSVLGMPKLVITKPKAF